MRALVEHYPFIPETCTWELTLQCNLNCGHCGSHAGSRRPNEMDAATAKRVAGELAAMGCRRLTLSGGEPTLCSYWPDVARVATDGGVKVNMITNGLKTDRELIRKAKGAGLVNLGVSLDGLEEQHDSIRGRHGMFQRVMRLLEDCAAERMPIGVITTIGKNNMHSLEALHDIIAPGAFVWQVQLAEAMGNQLRQTHPQIDPADLLHIVPTLARLIRKKKIEIRTADNIGYFGPFESVIRKSRKTPIPCWVGCYGGCRHVGIQADGTVKGCLSMQAVEAGEGNVTVSSLAEIWNRPGAFAYNRDFRVENLTGFCRTCRHVEICRGGCHSMRVCEGGTDNPFCYHRVATLADRERPRAARRYLPMAIAPAAILALAGCAAQVTDDYGVEEFQDAAGADADAAQDAPGSPTDARPPADASPDGEVGPPIYVDAYGTVMPDAAYGIMEPQDARADALPPIDASYGMAEPPDAELRDAGPDADAGLRGVEAYGIMEPPDAGSLDAGPDADARPPSGEAYGLTEPPDASPGEDAGLRGVEMYGIAEPPDADLDAETD
jgi:radical SAM protein with 4Fe4S-binding SPASM domain